MSNASAGMGKLNHGLKTLLAKWDTLGEVWRDNVRAEYEKKHLGELQQEGRVTLNAIQRLGQILDRAERECG